MRNRNMQQMRQALRPTKTALRAFALLSTAACLPPATHAAPSAPTPPAVIYCVYPSIASSSGNFAGVAAQLPRLKKLGVDAIWLMPVTPIGQATKGHPAFGSPYCVEDYFGVNPAYGTSADLKKLIADAHRLKIKVLLDEVLNHTSWDNALIAQHPEFYVHSDGNGSNPDSISMAFTYADVAQLDYGNPALWEYMNHMLAYWVTDYHVDGFRFDSADNPGGPKRKIPAAFWQQAGAYLLQLKPDVLLLEEGEAPDLAEKPFQIDYGWNLFDALKRASNGGDATDVVNSWKFQHNAFPTGMLHLAIQDDWDTPRDVAQFGGPEGAMAAAVFNFTIDGVPLLYNGMEIGNAVEAVNPHAPIAWDKGDAHFPAFYKQLIALRESNPAIRQGEMAWVTNSTPKQVLSYTRTGGGSQFLVAINLSNTVATGKIEVEPGAHWKPVKLGESSKAGEAEQYTLPPKGFAIYRRDVRPESSRQ